MREHVAYDYKTDTCDVTQDWNLTQIHMSWQKNVSSEEFNHYALVSEHWDTTEVASSSTLRSMWLSMTFFILAAV